MCIKINHSIIHQLLKFRAPSPHEIIRALVLLLLSASAAAATPHAAAPSSAGYSSAYGPYGIDANFNPSMTIIVVILVCAFLFIGFFSIYIRHCTDRRDANYDADGRLRRSFCGLQPSEIESFPVFVYSDVKDLKLGKGALECAVCITEFEDGETLRLLPKCDHVFHPECIKAWLFSHTTCPVCRANLTPDELTADDANRSASINSEPDEQNQISELVEVQNQVPIVAEENQTTGSQRVETVMAKIVAEKFPRSHSTGHSLVQLGDNKERYTLRLPEEVRKQLVSQKLKRTKSCVVVLAKDETSRRGNCSGGEGSSRGRQVGRSDRVGKSERWVFTVTPPFFSVTPPKVCNDDGEDVLNLC